MKLVPLLALLLAGCAVPDGRRPSGGIVSTNPCADAMLVELAPERIAALSHYSSEPGASSIPLDIARRYAATAGTAEEVIALRPDLVVTSSFTSPATREAYARLGLKVLLFDSPTSVAASEAQIAQLATAVGRPERGRAMIARIERALSPPRDLARPATLMFISGTLANGPGTLLDDLMARAGLRNAASDYGLTHSGAIAVEAIAARSPALLLDPGPSRGGDLRRKIVARVGARTHNAVFARSLIHCGGPTIVPAMARLAAIRRTLP